jgi:hypothetical protein
LSAIVLNRNVFASFGEILRRFGWRVNLDCRSSGERRQDQHEQATQSDASAISLQVAPSVLGTSFKQDRPAVPIEIRHDRGGITLDQSNQGAARRSS